MEKVSIERNAFQYLESNRGVRQSLKKMIDELNAILFESQRQLELGREGVAIFLQNELGKHAEDISTALFQLYEYICNSAGLDYRQLDDTALLNDVYALSVEFQKSIGRIYGWPQSVGIVEPALFSALHAEIPEWRKEQKFNALCLGSFIHNAGEFSALMKKFNKNALPVVIDIKQSILPRLKERGIVNNVAQMDAQFLGFKDATFCFIYEDRLCQYANTVKNVSPLRCT